MSKIIAGVDLSAESERAVAHGVAVARHLGSQLVLVLVDQVPDVEWPAAVRGIAERHGETITARLDVHRRELSAMRDRWIGHGVELSQLVVDGEPAERLPEVAAELGAELVVVGSRGRTGLKRVFLGSVAERVTRRADTSVLVARGDAPDGGYRRVVIGTDFSSQAELAIRRALPLVARHGRIELVHCWQVVGAVGGEAAMLVPYRELELGLEQALREHGVHVRGDLLRDRPDVELVQTLVATPAAHGIIDTATERGADLIVVGSHGRRGVRRFVLGSVAEVTVRHAPCSVLVAR